MIHFTVKSFSDLSNVEIYKILVCDRSLCSWTKLHYQDIDNKDQKAYHILGSVEDSLLAYARIFDSGDYFDIPSIGRIVVQKKVRIIHLNINW